MPGVKGRSGPRPKPTKLLVLQGTARRDRHLDGRSGEPPLDGDGSLPPPPEHLSLKVKEAWEEIRGTLKFKIFSREDVIAFGTFASMYALWKECYEHIEKEGVSEQTELKDGRIVTRMTTEASMWSDLNGKMLSYFARFGMTPSDRTRVREIGKSDANKENPDDEFAKQG
jgi:P27 family predicted phage terminase small subunit